MKLWRNEEHPVPERRGKDDSAQVGGEDVLTSAAGAETEMNAGIGIGTFAGTGDVSGAEERDGRKAFDRGLYYLQFSAKTEFEMRQKLAEQGFSPASVDYAVLQLKSYRYLDDEAYARRYLERGGNRKSERQLRYELQKKGISGELLDLVFEEDPIDEEERITALLKKRGYFGECSDPTERQKHAAYLTRKGFSYEAIRKAMQRL